MTTGDVWNCHAAVYQVLRWFVVQTPVNCDVELVLDPICHVEPVPVAVASLGMG